MKKGIQLFCLVGAAVFLTACGSGKKSDGGDTKDRYFDVTRGDFVISIEQEGMLDAIEHHVLRCPPRARQGLEIMYVVDDQTRVTNNQVVCKFVDEKYVDRRDDLIQEVDEQEKSLQLARDNHNINQSKSLSDIKVLVDKLRDERAALRRYVEQDAVQERDDLNREIELKKTAVETSQEKVDIAKDKLSVAQMSQKDKVDDFEEALETAETNLENAERNLEKARYNLRIFKQYDHPRTLRQLEQKQVQADMALQTKLISAKGVTLDGERKISSNVRALTKKKRDLEQVTSELEKMVLRAPTSGLVTLGDPNSRSRGNPKEIKIGTTMSQNEVVATIPDLSSFVIDMKLPEVFRSRIEVGQKATMTVKALPDLIIDGEIGTVADMASQLVWWDSSSPKIYKTEISTDCRDPRLMPGMSLMVEIQVDTVEDCLFVPVEALYNREGEVFCRVRNISGYEERKVETGKTSSDYVEIISGINEGEQVLLHRDGV